MKSRGYIFMLLCVGSVLFAKAQDSVLPQKNNPAKERPLKNLYIGGYYRAFIYSRHMHDAYDEHRNNPRTLSVGDGYANPIMEMIINGNPTQNTWFGTQLYFVPKYNGAGYEVANQVKLGLGVSMSGGIKTDQGKFDFELGGLNWKKLSQLTLWSNEGFNRFSIFNRTPWEETGNANQRYAKFFEKGSINWDDRWGKRAFSGVYITGTKLPKNFETDIIYGKTDNNGGVDSYKYASLPNQLYGGRIKKNINKNFVAFNTLDNVGQTDSINSSTFGFSVKTIEGNFKLNKNIALAGELGAGCFYSPFYTKEWSEAINLNVMLSKELTKVPITVQVYRLGKGLVNANATFFNTSIVQAQQSAFNLENSISLQPFNSPLVRVGQLTNNRQGINVNTEFTSKKFSLNFGYGLSTEIEKINPSLSFNHVVNGLTLSRLSMYKRNIGPYQRVNTYWQGYYEEIALTDTLAGGLPANSKYFACVEANAKLKLKVFNRNVYLFYLGVVNSVQKDMAVLPGINKKSYLRVYDNEFDVYYNIMNKLTITGYYGIERAIGNENTVLNTQNRNMAVNAATLKPINQTAQAVGVGLDIDIAPNAGLHIRHRWFTHSDKNFVDDKFSGTETTIELKVSFY